MPRNASGTYTLPSGNPVSSGTLIDATWANNTLNDLANEVTDSLSRSGEGGMLAPLRLNDGVQATPGLAFTNEPSTGMYRAGTNEAWLVAGGTQVLQFTTTGAVSRFAPGAVATPSITALGDLNTGLWFPAADTIAASTGGSERLRVDSSGNLGIGTTTPGQRLDVRGSSGVALQVYETSTGNNNRIVIAQEATISRFTSTYSSGSGNFAWNIGGTEVARLDSSGNLGIGTASPAAKLVVSNAGANGFEFDPTTGIAQTYNRSGAAYTGYKIYGLDLEFRAGASPAIAMTIDSNRNIVAGASVALATTATNGFLYVPTCAGTPTGVPTAITGMAPIVVNTTNNKLYFYSGGAWRDAGP
jgi:hypothetical protein